MHPVRLFGRFARFLTIGPVIFAPHLDEGQPQPWSDALTSRACRRSRMFSFEQQVKLTS